MTNIAENNRTERLIHFSSHQFQEMKPDMRPQDENLDGSGLSFKTLEHGGEHPDTMPQAIRVTDEKGRWCIYVPTEVGGKVVLSHGFMFTRRSTLLPFEAIEERQ